MYPITLKEVKVFPERTAREALILAYPLFFFLCYLFSSYSILSQPWEDPRIWPHYIGYRYMMPVMPFIPVILGIFAGRIRGKKISAMCVFLVLSLGLLGNLSIISLKNFGGFLNDRGYSYSIVGDKIGLRVKEGLKEYIAPFDRLSPNLREEFYEGLGSGIAWRLRDKNPDEVINIFETRIKKNIGLISTGGGEGFSFLIILKSRPGRFLLPVVSSLHTGRFFMKGLAGICIFWMICAKAQFF